MPSGKTYGNLALPSGFAHIANFGPSESKFAEFLYPFAWRDVHFQFDDFIGGESQESGVADFQESDWQDGNSANGTKFGVPTTQLVGGVIEAVTGAFADDTTALFGMSTWLGDNNCGMEIRYKLNNVTNIQLEMGFADPLSDQKLTAVNNIDTPTITNGAADVALVALDTGRTLTTMAFITDGSTTDMNTTKTDLGTRTPTNATYQNVRVQLENTASAVSGSYAFVFDENGGLDESAIHGAVLASQIKGDVLLEPLYLVESLSANTRTTDIDYIAVWQDR